MVRFKDGTSIMVCYLPDAGPKVTSKDVAFLYTRRPHGDYKEVVVYTKQVQIFLSDCIYIDGLANQSQTSVILSLNS